MTIPQAMHDLPELMAFIQQMRDDYARGEFTNWQEFIQPIRTWYTPQRLQAIDDVVMGWRKMSTYADQQTLIHLTAALVSLLNLEEYLTLTPDQQNLALWIVLYHDVEKEVLEGKRDHTHGFRSAATCAKGLVRHGLAQHVDRLTIQSWIDLTNTATRFDDTKQDHIQDNSKLESIMAGIDQVFDGRDNPASLIISGVLLHMSLDVVDDFPQAAPLTNDQICASITPALFPLLRVMMLTDSLAWSLFDTDRIAPEREQTLREFARVKTLLTP